MAVEKDIPAGRSARLLQLGRLAGGMAAGAVTQGLLALGSGGLPSFSGMLMTPANARRLGERLAEMRGAAMKVGQLLSMEAGDFLPREFTAVLAHLRGAANPMPLLQVNAQLQAAWGTDWINQFERFSFTPVAAASIGQVHEALTRDGRRLAIKIQYPGVRDSIDSDVDNVAALLKLFRLLPEPAVLDGLLQEARRELHAEADYLAEAQHITSFDDRIRHLAGFRVPAVDTALTGRNVLAMEYLEGAPVDTLAQRPAALRDAIATRLLQLFVHEVFSWGLVQTDPNFSNYLYLHDSGDLGLLDFGATRVYPQEQVDLLRRLLGAAIHGERDAIAALAESVGYTTADDPAVYRDTVVALLEAAAEPARAPGPYDFSASTLARRMSEQLVKLRLESRVWRMPPVEVLFLHRKLGGLYLLCSRLSATVDVRSLVERCVDAMP